MNTFDAVFKKTLSEEGGYTDNQKDRGNWTGGVIGRGICNGTKYGISAASYPYLDIKNLDVIQAKQIYKADYWDKCHCDLMPWFVALNLFDMAVNSGVKASITTLQHVLGVDVDGIIGNQTIKAAHDVEQIEFNGDFFDCRLAYVKQSKGWLDFGLGWKNRFKRIMADANSNNLTVA
jgi:lysozyme family protein